MNILLNLHELKNICMEMAQLGAMQAMTMTAPASDYIRKREACRWLASMGFDAVMLDRMEEDGLISKPVRRGKAVNSPLMYSKSEILSVITSLKLSKYINK